MCFILIAGGIPPLKTRRLTGPFVSARKRMSSCINLSPWAHLEERIDQMISDKQKMADSIVGNDESWLTKLDNQAFKELIALNKHSIMED